MEVDNEIELGAKMKKKSIVQNGQKKICAGASSASSNPAKVKARKMQKAKRKQDTQEKGVALKINLWPGWGAWPLPAVLPAG